MRGKEQGEVPASPVNSQRAEALVEMLPGLTRFFYLRTHNALEAEELAAEAVFRAFKGLASYQDRGYQFETWVFKICRNLAKDWGRKAHRHPVIYLGAYENGGEHLASHDLEDEAIARVDNRVVAEAIHQLPSAQRQVLALRYGQT